MSYNPPQDGDGLPPEEQPTVTYPASDPLSGGPSPVGPPQQNPYAIPPTANPGQQNPYASQPAANLGPQNPYSSQPWQQGGNPYGQQYAASSNAVVALVLSILGTVCCCTLMAPVGLYLGRTEMTAIDQGLRDPSQRGTAQAAFVLGIIGTVILVLAVLYYLGVVLLSL